MIVDCPHQSSCPGCAYLGVEYAVQLETKAKALGASLRAYPELVHVALEPTLGAPSIQRYRTRVKWMVGTHGEVGLYADGRTHEVVDIPGCRIAGEQSMRIAAELRSLLHEDRRGLFAVDIREIAGADRSRAMVTLVVEAGTDPKRPAELAAELERKVGAIASVFVNERVAGSSQVLGPRTRSLTGAPALVDRVGTVDVIATPGSFVQAHRAQAAFIEMRVVEGAARLAAELGRRLRVLELYAGSGAFGLALARAGCEVTFVESHPPAAESITKAAAAMRLPVEAVTDDAEAFVRKTKRRFDMVVVDPPRRGLPPGLRAGLKHLEARSIAYVSCDPETLARDLAHLARVGFSADAATPIDMIPLSEHVEALAFLRPRPRPPIRELASSTTCLVVEKPSHATVGDCLPSPEARAVIALEPGASGALGLTTAKAMVTATASIRCLVSGITRARGHIRIGGARATYDRASVVGGHSEIVISLESTHPASLSRVLDRLASFGHAPLGDATRAHPAALRHAFDARGIDRAMVHVERVCIGSGETALEAAAPVAPDFERALARMQ